ncbi:hypothetical protein WJX73_001170 [Symbiochloris irregularis]|uniref:CoA-binding domain-containing protein n=1 Tax=Symbiochloris irregularis TaxID=706552 RepID=A0AAW1NRS8_9CHLO
MAASVVDSETALKIARRAKRVAVLGIKPESKAGQPAYEVPSFLADTGVQVIPVPVYFPELTSVLGQKVYRKLIDIPGGPVDVVDVFRRPQDLPQHTEDIIAAKPRVVWLQTGISNSEVEGQLVAAGIDVVVDRCLMVDRRTALSRY